MRYKITIRQMTVEFRNRKGKLVTPESIDKHGQCSNRANKQRNKETKKGKKEMSETVT